LQGRSSLNKGDTLLTDKFIKRALETQQTVSGTDIVSSKELEKESYELSENSTIKIIPTPKSKQRNDSVETSGMMLMSAVPVFDRNKILIGVLMGGILLNRNYDLLNKIKEVVHEKEIYKGQEIGTETIFYKDLRITTNVKILTEVMQSAHSFRKMYITKLSSRAKMGGRCIRS